jgi:hypothetical protein
LPLLRAEDRGIPGQIPHLPRGQRLSQNPRIPPSTARFMPFLRRRLYKGSVRQ